jgi:hypothetical protein
VEADEWLTAVLGTPARLYHATGSRPIDGGKYSGPGSRGITLADGYPVHVWGAFRVGFVFGVLCDLNFAARQ